MIDYRWERENKRTGTRSNDGMNTFFYQYNTTIYIWKINDSLMDSTISLSVRFPNISGLPDFLSKIYA